MDGISRWKIAELGSVCEGSEQADWQVLLCRFLPPRSLVIALGVAIVLWLLPTLVVLLTDLYVATFHPAQAEEIRRRTSRIGRTGRGDAGPRRQD